MLPVFNHMICRNFIFFAEIAQDRFVPRESLSYFTQKNANRVRSPSNSPKECKHDLSSLFGQETQINTSQSNSRSRG